MKNMRIATLHSLEKDLAQGTMKDAQDLLDDFTHNKSIQKIRESYRVSKEDKERLKNLRRNPD